MIRTRITLLFTWSFCSMAGLLGGVSAGVGGYISVLQITHCNMSVQAEFPLDTSCSFWSLVALLLGGTMGGCLIGIVQWAVYDCLKCYTVGGGYFSLLPDGVLVVGSALVFSLPASGIFGLVILGGLVGSCQWFALRRLDSRFLLWIPATCIATLLLRIPFSGSGIAGILGWVIPGVITGVILAWLLPRLKSSATASA